MRYSYLLITVVFISLLAISACGRKGVPRPPDNIKNTRHEILNQDLVLGI